MVHLVGLGGGGCNVLEFAIKQNFQAVYTFVSSPKREIQLDFCEFIEFSSPQFYFANPCWYKSSINLPEQLIQKLLEHNNNIIVCCAGSYTGSMLVKAISGYNWPNNINFSYFVGTPFNFEGNKKPIINDLKISLKGLNVKYIPLQQIVKTEGSSIHVEKAFQKADHLMFSIIVPKSEPIYQPYITPFITQAIEQESSYIKFGSELYQLLKKRERYYDKQFRFTAGNLKKIERINKLLSENYKKAYAQAQKTEEFLLKQMKVKNSFVSDYEIEFQLSLWAEKKYSSIEELQGNSFFTYNPPLHFIKKETSNEVNAYKHFIFEENHNTNPDKYKNQWHCYLFHDLYDHTWLSWQDLVDIEELWIEVIVRIQHFTN